MLKLRRLNVIIFLIVAVVLVSGLSIAVVELAESREFSGSAFYVMAGWPASLAFLWYAVTLARLHLRDVDVMWVADGQFVVSAPLGANIDLSQVLEVRLTTRKAFFWSATFLTFVTSSGEKVVPLNGLVGPPDEILTFAAEHLDQWRRQCDKPSGQKT